MNKIYTILFFILMGFQCLAQKLPQEFFNFTDSTFKVSAIKIVPYMYHLCGNGIDEYDQKSIDSIAAFLTAHKSIVLELGVHNANKKQDRGDAEYFKSLLVKKGADASRIIIAGYGRKPVLYSYKTIKEAYKKHSDEGEQDAERMKFANFRIELKIIQQ